LTTESLEARLTFDASPVEAGAMASPAGDGLQFFLSEHGIGESPVLENPIIHMEVGETKSLYLWMRLPEDAGLYGAGITVVSTTSGVLSSAGASVYEPLPGLRWMSTQQNIIPSALTPGDILGEPSAFTISPRDLSSNLEEQFDPSYDAATGTLLFATVAVTAENPGETNLVMEVGSMAIAAWQPGSYLSPNLPIHLGAGDEAVSGASIFATGSLADATLIVSGTTTSSAVGVADEYAFTAVTGQAFEIPADEGVLVNDSIREGAVVDLVAGPRLGSVELAADGAFRYTAPDRDELFPNMIGRPSISDSFVYRIVTPDGKSSLTRATLHLFSGVQAADDYLTLDLHDASGLSLNGKFLGNDLALSQAVHLLQWEFASQPQHGRLTVANEHFWSYVPDEGFIGTDQFTYQYSDGTTTSTATIFVDVTKANLAPISGMDWFDVADPSQIILASALLANDVDPEGAPLQASAIQIVEQPSHGTLRVEFDDFIYESDAGFAGFDQFQYVVSDGNDESYPAYVVLNVSVPPPAPLEEPPPIEPPDAANDPLPADEGGSVVGNLPADGGQFVAPQDNAPAPANNEVPPGAGDSCADSTCAFNEVDGILLAEEPSLAARLRNAMTQLQILNQVFHLPPVPYPETEMSNDVASPAVIQRTVNSNDSIAAAIIEISVKSHHAHRDERLRMLAKPKGPRILTARREAVNARSADDYFARSALAVRSRGARWLDRHNRNRSVH
jgi:hypothetical protein